MMGWYNKVYGCEVLYFLLIEATRYGEYITEIE